MAASFDIPLRRNEDWSRSVTMSGVDGAPIDITGWSLALHVRSRTDNFTLIAAAEIDILSAEEGEFRVTLRASEGNPLSTYGSPLQIENLPYDLRATDVAGTKLVLIAGTVILSRGVTHG